MRIPPVPHAWAVSPKRAVAIQRQLAGRVRQTPPRAPIRLVAGVDLAFSRDGAQCIAGVVVWDLDRGEVVEERLAVRRLRFPYVPGLLSFREGPAILAALRRLRCTPDALICDGHGLAHPRRFGIACHIGVICECISVGCAKSRLVGEHAEPAARRGSRRPLTHRGERIGTVLRTRDGVKPIFVSVGHRIDLASCERLVLRCGAGRRLPEPTRRADRLVAAAKLELA